MQTIQQIDLASICGLLEGRYPHFLDLLCWVLGWGYNDFPWCTARALHRLPALPSFRQSSLPQRAVHLVDIFGRKTVQAMNGVGLADREIWPALQKLCDQRLGFIDPTEERQRISLAELANAETINIGIGRTEILERLSVLAPPPMACRWPQL